MADSKVTKKAMAEALKELSVNAPFAKISIGDICKKCNMSRKTFYYHFKDKEDLVNWIFDTEFIANARNNTYESVWDAIEDLLKYFYRNINFYKKILFYEGQNSFALYFNELIHSIFVQQLQTILQNPSIQESHVNFVADGMVCMLKRWMSATKCTPPDVFIEEIKSGAKIMATYIFQTLPETEQAI